MAKTSLSLRDQALCLGLAKVLIEPLRAVARANGYALAEHGSQRRDIDLIAVAWTEEACDPVVLAEAIRAEAERIVGVAFYKPDENDELCWRGKPGLKPHRRLAWSFHLGGGPYIDLSVMPPLAEPWPETGVVPDWPRGQEPQTSAELAATDPITPMTVWEAE
ncbi:MAG TPA: hypothetical protein VL418_03875 [Devosiaceae bacterium]|jgi:hypothetical protein|nr:hypothetical protein [Devosiaceae bacterium]